MEKIIKNFSDLAISPLRQKVLEIAEAGYEAVRTKDAVRSGFVYDAASGQLDVAGKKFNLNEYERVVCVGFGKAALEAVGAIHEILGPRIACGYVIDLKDGALGNITCKIGTHPYPTTVNVKATMELVEMLKTAGERDLVICVVSGGGSALLCYPHDLSCEAETSIIAALTTKGADIGELNTVRKHISQVKGGHLAEALYPATCISLIFSDVPGDELSLVASGPTVKDTSTNADAAKILEKYDVLELCQMPTCRLLETPKEDKYFEKVHNILFVSAQTALDAMVKKAESLGFKTKIFNRRYQGEAKVLGAQIVSQCQPGECLLGTGESTVKIVGKGTGGRNQEMALAAALHLSEGGVMACMASDGHDNTEAAGAIADAFTLEKAKKANLDPVKYLDDNDSFSFFAAVGDGLKTGLTGSNISDFFVCAKE